MSNVSVQQIARATAREFGVRNRRAWRRGHAGAGGRPAEVWLATLARAVALHLVLRHTPIAPGLAGQQLGFGSGQCHAAAALAALEQRLRVVDGLLADAELAAHVERIEEAIDTLHEVASHQQGGGAALAGVIVLTAEAFAVTPAELRGPSRKPRFVVARQAAMWAARTCLGCGLSVIGRALGRDHSTVLAALRAFERRLAADPELRVRVAGIAARAAEDGCRQSDVGCRKTATALTLPLVPAVLPTSDIRLPTSDPATTRRRAGRMKRDGH